MKKLGNLWQNLQLWRNQNKGKALKEMPTTYLFMQFTMSSFVVTMLPTMLVPATNAYFDVFKYDHVPWWWSLIGLWLLGWWILQIATGLISYAHGRALGEQIFTPGEKKRPYHFEAKVPRRFKNRRS